MDTGEDRKQPKQSKKYYVKNFRARVSKVKKFITSEKPKIQEVIKNLVNDDEFEIMDK